MTDRPAEGPDREALGDLLAHHAFSRVNEDGWTVCLCGHVAEGDDDDGSHGRHQADAVLALLPTPPAPGDGGTDLRGRIEALLDSADPDLAYQHVNHAIDDGDPDCGACWVADLRAALAGATPEADRG
jgi:hypothetical protein